MGYSSGLVHAVTGPSDAYPLDVCMAGCPSDGSGGYGPMLVGYGAFVMRGDGYCEPSVWSYSDGVSAFILGVVGFEVAGTCG